MKLVVERASGKVLGAHMLGPDAAEIIQGIAIAIRAGSARSTLIARSESIRALPRVCHHADADSHDRVMCLPIGDAGGPLRQHVFTRVQVCERSAIFRNVEKRQAARRQAAI